MTYEGRVNRVPTVAGASRGGHAATHVLAYVTVGMELAPSRHATVPLTRKRHPGTAALCRVRRALPTVGTAPHPPDLVDA